MERMTFGERLADGLKREKIVKKWPKRIKKTGLSRAQFCDKYGLDESQMSRHIKGRNAPEWENINKVERALEHADV